jgi:hypothetical protein
VIVESIAWVESPLQLIGAAEWAAAHRVRVTVAGRLSPQISQTADALIERGARFGRTEPYLGIPWKLLASHKHWIVGDGFSGQFRLALTVLRPRRVTFLDDGDNTPAYARSLLGQRPYARPNIDERGLTTFLAPLAGRADLFTAYDLGAEQVSALAQLGFAVERHGFEWIRESAPATKLEADRVLLGSALAVDGRMPLADYLAWVASEAAAGDVAYVPHRREPDEQRRAVTAIAGVHLVDLGLPIELLLAGAAPREVVTLPSSTATTLPLVLTGTGTRVRVATPRGPGAPSRTPSGRG